MDVTELPDEELLSMLKSRGVDVGPIVDSTRKVYQRKLQRMIAEENGTEGYVVQEEEVYEEQDDYDAANADTQPVEYISQPTYRTGSPSRQHTSSPAREPRSSPARSTKSYRPDGDDTTRHYGENVTLTRREIRTTSSTTSTRSQSQPSTSQVQAKPKAKKSGLSICVQVAIFVIVAVLIYLVIMNMEPAAKDPLKGIDV